MHVATLTLYAPEMKIAEVLNSVDPDEVPHNEWPHLALHCLLFNLRTLDTIQLA